MIVSRAFVFLNCEIGTEKAIIKQMLDIKGVSQSLGVSGIYDIVAELIADSDKDISKIIKRFRSLPSVRSCLTMVVAGEKTAAGDVRKEGSAV